MAGRDVREVGLSFTLFSREQVEQSRSGNPFDEIDLLVARLDQLARNEDLQAKLRLTRWDLVVVDEAHKLSATYFGNKLDKTKRFELGELLGEVTRHFLLMTATPHNGKEADFHLFLSPAGRRPVLRQAARRRAHGGRLRPHAPHGQGRTLTFDGTPLFPERRAYTVNYKLSDPEAALYTAVTNYVKEEWQKADTLADGKRKGTVGFALTTLQRRLASSPEPSTSPSNAGISGSSGGWKRRNCANAVNLSWQKPCLVDPEDADDLNAEEQEQLEEAVVDQATAAQTIQELEAEIRILQGLEEQAHHVVHAGQDRKWDELSKLLQNTPEMRDASGRQRKLIVFSEHRDTLRYLQQQIGGLLGDPAAIVTIHGGVKREDRRKVQELFRNDPATRVTRHGCCWGRSEPPERQPDGQLRPAMEPQPVGTALGRIHRIGQTEVCHLWNMVAAETREGDVFQRLFEKLDAERQALGGRVFDILGEVFEEKSLRDLLIEAIRYGEDPAIRARLLRRVEGARYGASPEHPPSQRAVRRGHGRAASLRRQGGDGEGRGAQAPAVLYPRLLHAGLPAHRR